MRVRVSHAPAACGWNPSRTLHITIRTAGGLNPVVPDTQWCTPLRASQMWDLLVWEGKHPQAPVSVAKRVRACGGPGHAANEGS